MSGYYNRNNRGITKKLGPVTAYADAVLAGYKGTREQWAQDMAKLGQNVTQVAQNTKLTTELAEQTRVNTEQVAKDTADVRELAEETSDNAVQVASNTAESNRLAEETKQAAAQAKEDAEYAGAAADNFRVDTTLSEAGKAAEAKTTGEKFAQLSEDIVTLQESKKAIPVVYGGVLPEDSKLKRTFIDVNGTITPDYPNYSVCYYSVPSKAEITVSGKIMGYAVAVVSVWTADKTTMKKVVYETNTTADLISYSVDLVIEADEVLAVTHYVDNDATVTVNGVVDELSDNTKALSSMVFGGVLLEDSKLKRTFIHVNGTITPHYNDYSVCYYSVPSKAEINVSGKIMGVAVAVVSVWTADKTTMKKVVYETNTTADLVSYSVDLVLEADEVLAVTHYIDNDAAVTTRGAVDELSDNAEQLQKSTKTLSSVIFGGELFEDSRLEATYINVNGTITPRYPDYSVCYYSAPSKTEINVSGKFLGSAVAVVSVWTADKTTMKKVVYQSNQINEPIPYSVNITLEQDEVLAVTHYVDNDATVTVNGVVDELSDKDLRSLQDFNQPNFIPPDGVKSSETQSTPDFSTLSGKIYNAVGDSITAGDYYRSGVSSRLGVTVVNCGISASTLAVNNTYLQNKSIVERVCGLNGNTPYEDADIWTILGGVNDGYYNTPIGTIESTDITTIYGSLKAICENLRGRKNNPKVLLMTPMQSTRDNETMREIVKAIKVVGKLYSCPVIDLYNESGICHTNIRNVLSDGVHPNDIGNAMLVSAIASGIKRNC